MDPDAAWKEIVDLAEAIRWGNDALEDVGTLVDTILGLRDWIAKGGFPPTFSPPVSLSENP